MNERKPIRADGDKEEVMEDQNWMNRDIDDLDRFIMCALTGCADWLSPQVDDTGTTLTDADRAALAALGPPLEFVRRALSRMPEETPAWQECQADLETRPEVDRFGFEKSREKSPEFLQLVVNYEGFQKTEHVAWNCEYRIKEEIGRGGQGVVMLVESLDNSTGDRALKLFTPEPYDSIQSYENEMKRMAAVAKIVQENWHENLLHAERFDQVEQLFRMCMRLVDGFDLRLLLQKGTVTELEKALDNSELHKMRTVVYGPCGTEQWGLQHGSAVHIIQQCLRGLGALHSVGIVHCDIKPENLMIDSHGCVRLIDIGSAYELSSPPEEHAWTPRYAPPEVLEGGEWTKKADLASAGYVLVELLSGQSDVLIKLPGEKSPSVDLAMRSQSVRLLDQKTREKLAEVKRQLPGQLVNLIPRPHSPRLIPICNNLIDPSPGKRFESAENAIFDDDGTRRFLNQLDNANLAARWASDLRLWVEGVKRRLAGRRFR